MEINELRAEAKNLILCNIKEFDPEIEGQQLLIMGGIGALYGLGVFSVTDYFYLTDLLAKTVLNVQVKSEKGELPSE